MITILSLLAWTYRQMRSAAVLEARKESGRSITRPRLAIGFGILIVALVALLLNTLLNGPVGTKAMQLARQKLGPDYQYATQSIRVSGRHCSGMVAAWNDKEIIYVPVSWSK